MKPHYKTRVLRKTGHLVLAVWLAALPAVTFAQSGAVPAVAAPTAPPTVKAVQRYAVVGYDRSIRQQDFAGLGTKTVLQMQRHLEVIYRDLPDWQRDFTSRKRPLNDGVVGPVTLEWLQRYAFTFKFTTGPDLGKDFPPHMERMAAFGAAHPAELAILLDKPFEEWDSRNPATTRAQDFAVRRRADEAALLDLVRRYLARGTAVPVAVRAAPPSDGYYTYVLTAKDLERLGGKAEVGTTLAKLKDKPYASKEALRAALEQTLPGRAAVLDKVWPAIDLSLRPFNGFLLNAASLSTLKKEGMAPGTLEELTAFGTVYLKSADAFDTYITAKIETGELTITDDSLALLADTTRVLDNYHLDQQALDTIEKQLSGSVHYVGLPAAVVGMLGQIKEVDYVDKAIFHSAARSEFALGLGMCKKNTPVNNVYVAQLAIPAADLASLQKDLERLLPMADGNAVPELAPQFQRIGALRELEVRCDDVQKAEADAIAGRLYATYLMASIDRAGRKAMPDTIVPPSIKGGDCGCALDNLAGVVYGFYPYWREQKGAQTINFRGLNRMAYTGLTVDNAGEFRLGARSFNIRDGSAEANEFVRVAHQYNSKVDWLIHKNDWDREWQGFSVEKKKQVFQTMLGNISILLNAPLTNVAARLKGWTTFAGPPPRRGDGVTLYFPNYPADDDSVALFNEFYRLLRDEMDRHDLWLNILVTQDTLAKGKNGGAGAFGLSNLIDLRKRREQSIPYMRLGADKNDEYLLVLLNEPTADAKKTLRLDLENDSRLHGAARADFLRSILPIMHFDDHNWQQLDDDIVYARDNFGGMGFWAPDFDNLASPVTDPNQSCAQSKQIAVCVLKNYRDQAVHASLAGPVEALACVHRWVLHWIMLCLVAASIVLIVLFFKFCKVQAFIKEHFLWVQLLIVLPALLVFILLLLYDPFMLSISQGNLPFFISTGLIMVGLGAGYLFWRSQRDVPQRERGLPQRQATGFPILVWKLETGQGGFAWVIRNRGTGYAIIKKVEILLDGKPMPDARTVLESVMGAGADVRWQSIALLGQKIEPGKQLVGLSVPQGDAASALEQQFKEHALAVKITYCGPNNEHWISDESGIASVSGVV